MQPWGSRDFSSKRIAAPKAGGKIGLVQIDPNEEPYFLTPQQTGEGREGGSATVPPVDGHSAWFWSSVSPDLEAGSAERLGTALGQLAAAESDPGPGWAALGRLISNWGATAQKVTEDSRVSPALVLAVIAIESAGRPDAVSSAGAAGLMQLMPATAARFGVSDRTDPEENIAGGVAYLEFLLRTFGDDPILALAAYNAGEGSVAEHGGVPPFAETRAYVPKVLSAWASARIFCEKPPEKFTDPCKFSAVASGG